jgi:hypothetical protein
MGTLENLLVQEKALVSKLQDMGELLSGVRVHIAELRSVNRGAVTYNLPSETISAIFEAGLSKVPKIRARNYASRFDQSEKRTTSFELLVSSVSRRWRYIALNTPQLWTVVAIDALGLAHDLYDLYLCRSKMCPLEITLDCFFTDGRKKADWNINFVRHLERLIPHVGHWRKFTVSSGYMGSWLSALSHLRAPILEMLVLDFEARGPGIEIFSGGAPHLSSLDLTERYFRPPLAAIKYLKLIRDFHIPPLSYDQLSQLMQPMRSLACLSISAVIVTDTGDHPPIELPSVLVLGIYFNYDDTDSSALRLLEFLAVQTMTIHSSANVAIRAVARNHCVYPHIQSLTLVGDAEYDDREDTPVDLTLDFISLLPDVQDIVFQYTNPCSILSALHDCKTTDEVPWPNLSAITAKTVLRAKVMHKKQTWACVVKVVEKWVELGHPISSVKLSPDIVERGGQRQKQRLREQVALTEY